MRGPGPCPQRLLPSGSAGGVIFWLRKPLTVWPWYTPFYILPPPVANPRAPRHAREDVPSSLEGWHARVEHHAQHAPPAAWECCTRAVRHAVHLAALRNSPRQLPRCERFGLASTLSKHSTLHDLSHVLDARVHLMRVLEAAGAAGRERARLEYAEARWQRLEADGPTLRGCCVLAAA